MSWWEIDFDTIQYQQLIQTDLPKQSGVSLLTKESFRVKYPHLISGKPEAILSSWENPKVEFDGLDGNIIGNPNLIRIMNADIISAESILTFSALTINYLNDFIKDSVELLDLDDGELGYKVVNVVNVIDCLDYEQSKITYFDDGDVRKIEEYVFEKTCLEGQHIFKIKEHYYGSVIVSELFKNTVEQNGLVGAKFRKLCD